MTFRNTKLFLIQNCRTLILISLFLPAVYVSVSFMTTKKLKLKSEFATKWDFGHEGMYAASDRAEIIKNYHRIPEEYVNCSKCRQFRSCGNYPWFTDLHFSTNYWQTLDTEDGVVQILSGAYDDRVPTDRVVRITTMINRKHFNLTLACQVWYNLKADPVITEEVDVELVWFQEQTPGKEGVYLTYLISCHLPSDTPLEAPESVSIVRDKCDLANNNVKVFDERLEGFLQEKKTFGVCVRAINFVHSNYAIKLAEWIELMEILGAEMITIYTYQTDENFQKVLDYYQDMGRIEHYRITVPTQLDPFPSYVYYGEKTHEGYCLELAAYHECFYRNFQKVKYITLIDIDEVLVPTNNDTSWFDMFNTILKQEKAQDSTFFLFQQTYFYSNWTINKTAVADIPIYTPMLRYVTRADILPTYFSPKGFHDTRYSRVLFNHWVLNCTEKDCQIYNVSETIGQVNHYRGYFNNNTGNVYIEDRVLWKYKDELIDQTTKALKELDFITED